MKHTILCLCVLFAASTLCAADTKSEPVKVQKANYELAGHWTAAKVGKLVFDTAVTPHWLETGDRFWYSYETSRGRYFYLVDPSKKTKTPVFDAAKMAAMLTAITRTPYDAQHLPIRTIKFTKNDTVIEFELQVDRDADINGKQTVVGGEQQTDQTTSQPDDPQQRGGGATTATAAAPRTRTLYFEYEIATGKLSLPPEFTPEPKKPAWASISPDEKTVVFARKHDLYMMDAMSYALSLKKADDPGIKEVQLTKDGEENFSYARHISGSEIQQQQQRQEEQQDSVGGSLTEKDKTGRVPPIVIHWSKDSKRIAVVRRDERKVGDLWVIRTLENPRPAIETYKYAMPGEANVPQSHLETFDIAAKTRTDMKTAGFKDQTICRSRRTARHRAPARARTWTAQMGGRAGSGQTLFPPHEPRPAQGRRVRGESSDGRSEGADRRSHEHLHRDQAACAW